ncbi:hypothetical protein EZV62_007688 [Acer yangbiense]|uniref:Uncharacterized protein n=1 Tax=Acer yangbiense TaxID=1000413 RepID=A0A5C7IA91_9ROSI|nr:hypothetical protein EZV62_007688 [Acer yangbiense]
MFMGATIKGKQVCTMRDTRAPHNFISVDKAKRLGLRVTNEGGAIKVANSPVKQIDNTANGVTIHQGPWSKKLDDYQVVLGMAFFDQANIFPLPATSSLSILDRGKAHHPDGTYTQVETQDAIRHSACGETKFSHFFEEQQANRKSSEENESCKSWEATIKDNKGRLHNCQTTVSTM